MGSGTVIHSFYDENWIAPSQTLLYLKGCVNTQACDFVLNKMLFIG
jgi:hypothetical protein